MRVVLALAMTFAALAPSRASAAATAYTFVNFDVPTSGSRTYALGINDAGQTVGYSIESSQLGPGFLRGNDGSYAFLAPPAAALDSSTEASDINNAGQIVGFYYKYGDNTQSFGFLRDPNGAYTILKDPLGTYLTVAEGLNDAGQIVGYYLDGRADNYGFLRNPDGSYTTIAPPNVTNRTIALGINNLGQIVGEYEPFADRVEHGFLRNTNGTYTDISVPVPNVNFTSAEGINDSGQIVGYYYVNQLAGAEVTPYGQGFVRDADGNYTIISDPAGTLGSRAVAINDAGQILGQYFDNDGLDGYGIHAFIATPVVATAVPEPAGLTLLGTGLFGLCLVRRAHSRPRRLAEQGGPGA